MKGRIQTVVKSSFSFVSYTSTEKGRWGYYSGMARKHNASVSPVWLSGMFANSSGVWDSRIGGVYSSALSVKESTKLSQPFKLYHNPVIKNFSLEISLQSACDLEILVKDIQGKVV